MSPKTLAGVSVSKSQLLAASFVIRMAIGAASSCSYVALAKDELALSPEKWPQERMHREAASLFYSPFYVHRWIAYPSFVSTDLDGTKLRRQSQPGITYVDLFLASWCIPCQRLASKVLALHKKYIGRRVRFAYIFAHDLRLEARSFAIAHKLPGGLLANHEILKAFHNPPLPSIYIGDKDGFLLHRYERLKNEDIEHLDRFLDLATQF